MHSAQQTASPVGRAIWRNRRWRLFHAHLLLQRFLAPQDFIVQRLSIGRVIWSGWRSSWRGSGRSWRSGRFWRRLESLAGRSRGLPAIGLRTCWCRAGSSLAGRGCRLDRRNSHGHCRWRKRRRDGCGGKRSCRSRAGRRRRRGRRLAVSVSQASPDNDNNCPHSSCRAPTSSDAPHKMANHHSQRAVIRLARCWTARRSASLWQPDAVPENAHNARHWRAMPQACPARPVGLCRAPQSGLPSTP